MNHKADTNDLNFNVKWAKQGKMSQSEKTIALSTLQDTLLEVAGKHADLSIFKSPTFSKLVFIEASEEYHDSQDLIKMVNTLLGQMTQIFALKQNEDFLKLFGIFSDPATSPQQQKAPLPKTGSLLR